MKEIQEGHRNLMKGLMESGVDDVDETAMWRAWTAEWELAKQRPPPADPGGERQGHGGAKYVWRGVCTRDEMCARQAKATLAMQTPHPATTTTIKA